MWQHLLIPVRRLPSSWFAWSNKGTALTVRRLRHLW